MLFRPDIPVWFSSIHQRRPCAAHFLSRICFFLHCYCPPLPDQLPLFLVNLPFFVCWSLCAAFLSRQSLCLFRSFVLVFAGWFLFRLGPPRPSPFCLHPVRVAFASLIMFSQTESVTSLLCPLAIDSLFFAKESTLDWLWQTLVEHLGPSMPQCHVLRTNRKCNADTKWLHLCRIMIGLLRPRRVKFATWSVRLQIFTSLLSLLSSSL